MNYCLNIIAEPSNKGTIVLLPSILHRTYNTEYRSGTSSLLVVDESIHLLFVGMEFKLFSPFLEAFNEKIDWMISSGLPQFWHNNFVNPRNLKRIPEEIGPQVLTMDHLEIAFKVCLSPLILSVFVFVVEVCVASLKNFVRKYYK